MMPMRTHSLPTDLRLGMSTRSDDVDESDASATR
jgi:hypothetical protein